jgi:hypothetical protein
MANKFNDHFTTMATVISETVNPTDRPPDLNSKSNAVSFNNSHVPITTDEFLNAMDSTKTKNSTDFCGLSSAFMKQTGHLILKPLLHIVHNSFRQGVVPNQLKCAKVITNI